MVMTTCHILGDKQAIKNSDLILNLTLISEYLDSAASDLWFKPPSFTLLLNLSRYSSDAWNLLMRSNITAADCTLSTLPR